MTYAEYISQFETGLFAEINQGKPFEWNDLYTPEELDILFLFKHGNKRISKRLIGVDIETVAKIVFTAYNVSWKKKFEAFNVDFKLGESSRINTTESKGFTEKFTSDSETVNKEGAFNSDDLVADGGTEDRQSNQSLRDETRQVDEVKTSFYTLREQMRMLENLGFIDDVLNDVSKLILLKIY